MNMLRLIGDVHGKLWEYEKLLTCEHPTVQIGDLGAGFLPIPEYEDKDRFLRGNHDSPDVCRNMTNWIPDGTVEGTVMYIGGAWSIDHANRIPGISWWHDEELSWPELQRMIEIATTEIPRIIITHDAPTAAIEGHLMRGKRIQTRTTAALDVILEYAPPALWVFGHWHKTVRHSVGPTTFQCLGELDYIDVDLDSII